MKYIQTIFSIAVLVSCATTGLGAEDNRTNIPVFNLAVKTIPRHRPNITGRILVREIYRQALLIAARDEWGMRTRDECLGEHLGNKVFYLDITIPAGNRVKLALLAKGEKTPLWKQDIRLTRDTFYTYIPHIIAAEKASRVGFPEACRAAGLTDERKANPRGNDRVPKWLHPYINRMGHESCFLSIRKLHELCRRKGESVFLLCQLARCYAELGTFCEPFWNSSPKAFFARGLLYAQRAKARQPENPTALLTFSYVLALSGMHIDALKTYQQAAKIIPKGAIVPKCTAFFVPLCKYDLKNLAMFKQDPRAQYLRFLAAEFITTKEKLIKLGQEVLDVIPHCYRVHDRLARKGGVSNRHGSTIAALQALSVNLCTRLKQADILRDRLTPIINGCNGRADPMTERRIIDVLLNAGKTDVKEPSWACLGRMIHEIAFRFAMHRVRFMKNWWCVPVDDFLLAQKPILETHPFGA